MSDDKQQKNETIENWRMSFIEAISNQKLKDALESWQGEPGRFGSDDTDSDVEADVKIIEDSMVLLPRSVVLWRTWNTSEPKYSPNQWLASSTTLEGALTAAKFSDKTNTKDLLVWRLTVSSDIRYIFYLECLYYSKSE